MKKVKLSFEQKVEFKFSEDEHVSYQLIMLGRKAIPAKVSSRVVLPQPEGPMRASTSPGRAKPLRPSRITARPFLPFMAVTERSFHVRNTSVIPGSTLSTTPVAGGELAFDGSESERQRGKKMGLDGHADQPRHETMAVLDDVVDRSGLVGLGVGAHLGSGDAAMYILSLCFLC